MPAAVRRSATGTSPLTATVIIYWGGGGEGGESTAQRSRLGSQNSLSISFPEILKRQNRKPLGSLYYLTYFLRVRPPVCMQEGETEEDEQTREGGKEWRDQKEKEERARERERVW